MKTRRAEPNLDIDMTSHNVYFATRLFDFKMNTNTPSAGDYLR
jgi:hypothetical protein